MRIERTLPFVETLGPGKRLVIWTNGCPRHCEGCVTPGFRMVNERIDVNIEEFFLSYDFSLYDGVTISGGDPFMQVEELKHLLTYLKDKGIKDILVYTGYTLKEIKDNPRMNECLPYIDVLIDGPYIDSMNDDKDNLRGSKNQNIIYLNEALMDRYEKYHRDERKMEEHQFSRHLVGVGIPTREYIMDFKRSKICQ